MAYPAVLLPGSLSLLAACPRRGGDHLYPSVGLSLCRAELHHVGAGGRTTDSSDWSGIICRRWAGILRLRFGGLASYRIAMTGVFAPPRSICRPVVLRPKPASVAAPTPHCPKTQMTSAAVGESFCSRYLLASRQRLCSSKQEPRRESSVPPPFTERRCAATKVERPHNDPREPLLRPSGHNFLHRFPGTLPERANHNLPYRRAAAVNVIPRVFGLPRTQLRHAVVCCPSTRLTFSSGGSRSFSVVAIVRFRRLRHRP